jgi:hypothetical protein
MQFMPFTAMEMGLSPVYTSGVLDRAFEVDDRSRELYSRAVSLMRGESYNRLPGVVQQWKTVNRRASDLFREYRESLREKIEGRDPSELRGVDQRFLIDESVSHGVKYLARLFKKRKGDVREALAAYNAGPGSVRQYGGIPPYDQTVKYQNEIVNTYRKYRRYLTGDRLVRPTQITAHR